MILTLLGSPLIIYLKNFEDLTYTFGDQSKATAQRAEFSETIATKVEKKVYIKRPLFSRLALDITATAKGQILLEQMLDLDVINKLILTGEMPKKQE